MNKVIAGRDRSGRHPTKNASFDILSLADQLYRSKLSYPDNPERGKIYFFENQVPDLLMQGKAYLHPNIFSYNKAIEEHALFVPVSEKELAQLNEEIKI